MQRNSEQSFSQTLRGARLGYRWHPQLHAYMKISDVAIDKIAISIRPNGTISGRRSTEKREYRCWWEGEDVIPLIACLRNITRVKKPLDFYVNDLGELTP